MQLAASRLQTRDGFVVIGQIDVAIWRRRIYDFILNNLRDKFRIPLPVVEPHHGGGERLAAVLAEKVSDRRIVCAIADSDVSSPVAEQPNKVTRLRRVPVESNWPLAFVFCPPCKEIENLIPIEIVALLDSAVGRNDTFATLRLISDREIAIGVHTTQRYWLYFDVKKGYVHDAIARLHPTERTWIIERHASAGVVVPAGGFQGFGENVVTQLMSSNAACARLRTAIRAVDWINTFQDFLADVLWICAGGARQVT